MIQHPRFRFPSLNRHPLTLKCPNMTTEEFVALVACILQKGGLLEPVMLCEGMIVDGYHLYLACQWIYHATGENYLETNELPADADLFLITFSKNLVRRNLTQSQKAMIAVREEDNLMAGATLHRRHGEKSATFLARTVGVSTRYVQYAVAIKNHGTELLVECVVDGLVRANVAELLVKSYSGDAIDDGIRIVRIALQKELDCSDRPNQAFKRRFGKELRDLLSASGGEAATTEKNDIEREANSESAPSGYDSEESKHREQTIADIVFFIETAIAAYACGDPNRLAALETVLRQIAERCAAQSTSPPEAPPVHHILPNTPSPHSMVECQFLGNKQDGKLRREICTIGYEGLKPSEFLSVLVEAGVEVVVDVRKFPHRASMGSFKKAKSSDKGIEKLLDSAGIGYVWAEELGNPDRNDPNMREFCEQVVPHFPKLVAPVLDVAIQRKICLLCAEKCPEECHRLFIADYFKNEGWSIVHL